MLADWKTLDTKQSSLAIDLSEDDDQTTIKETTGWVQSWDRNRSFIDPVAYQEEGKGKKVELTLCLTKHHAMKAYWGSAGIAPRILWTRH
jgi:hypothetical protein